MKYVFVLEDDVKFEKKYGSLISYKPKFQIRVFPN